MFKKTESFVNFFLGRLNWLSELYQITIKLPLWPNFLRRKQILKNRPKKGFVGTFLEHFEQKPRFLALPSTLVYCGTEGAFRTILGSISQKLISENSTRGTLWVGRESNLWGWRPPPPLNPRLIEGKKTNQIVIIALIW